MRSDEAGGLQASVPVVLGYLPASVAFGVAGRGAGLNLPETLLMSLVVYSGASQFALAALISSGTSLLFAGISALLLSLRHLLYGLSLAPRIPRLGLGKAAILAFGLTDEAFAVASSRIPQRGGFRWIMGLEISIYVTWIFGTILGAITGMAILETAPSLAPALAFALPALFVALLVPVLRGRKMILPAIFAGAIAIALHISGYGGWSVLAAGISGIVFGVMRKGAQ